MMSGSLNKVQIIGNLGADPEIRATPGGAQVANFRVACAETWKDASGQRQTRTEWVTVVAWRQQAEIAAKYLRKGSKVYIEGQLQTRTFKDRDGNERKATEVVLQRYRGELTLLDTRKGDDGDAREPARKAADHGTVASPAASADRPSTPCRYCVMKM